MVAGPTEGGWGCVMIGSNQIYAVVGQSHSVRHTVPLAPGCPWHWISPQYAIGQYLLGIAKQIHSGIIRNPCVKRPFKCVLKRTETECTHTQKRTEKGKPYWIQPFCTEISWKEDIAALELAFRKDWDIVVAGDWNISIMYDGIHIQGSPFSVRVYDAAQVKVFGLEGGSVGRIFAFSGRLAFFIFQCVHALGI